MQVPCVPLMLFLYSSIHPCIHPSVHPSMHPSTHPSWSVPVQWHTSHPPRLHVLTETHQGQSSPRTELAHRIRGGPAQDEGYTCNLYHVSRDSYWTGIPSGTMSLHSDHPSSPDPNFKQSVCAKPPVQDGGVVRVTSQPCPPSDSQEGTVVRGRGPRASRLPQPLLLAFSSVGLSATCSLAAPTHPKETEGLGVTG